MLPGVVDKEVDLLLRSLNKEEAEILYASFETYEEVPCDIDTFATDPYFLGGLWGGSAKLFSVWREKLKELFPHKLLPSPYIEIIVTGSIGTGKSTFSYIGLAYNLYRLLLIDNPQDYFGLGPTTDIRFFLFNVTLDLAFDAGFNDFSKIVSISPFFKNIFSTPKDEASLIFPKNIGITVASQAKHILSKAVAGGILDETNFEWRDKQVYNAYTSALRRMESRFMKDGRVVGHLYLVSSNVDESDFTETHAQEIDKVATSLVVRASLFDTQKEKEGVYSGKTFKVFTGDKFRTPSIPTKKEDLSQYPEDRLLDVPVEHKDSFKKDIVNALRDIAGITTSRTRKFLRDPSLIKKIVKVFNVAPDKQLELSYSGSDQLFDYLDINKLGVFLYQNDGAPRYCHLDLSLGGDAVGFAMSHLSGYLEMNLSDEDASSFVKERRITAYNLNTVSTDLHIENVPIIKTELCLSIIKYKNERLPLFKLRKFITDLSDFEFPITWVTADSFQSADTMQLLSNLGYQTEVLSVDRQAGPKLMPAPYQYFYNAMPDGRVLIPNYSFAINELKDLNDIDGCIDHPANNGTKDCIDAIVGSSYKAFIHSRETIML